MSLTLKCITIGVIVLGVMEVIKYFVTEIKTLLFFDAVMIILLGLIITFIIGATFRWLLQDLFQWLGKYH
jgi:fructose-specific phosphotransferase system IIC component